MSYYQWKKFQLRISGVLPCSQQQVLSERELCSVYPHIEVLIATLSRQDTLYLRILSRVGGGEIETVIQSAWVAIPFEGDRPKTDCLLKDHHVTVNQLGAG